MRRDDVPPMTVIDNWNWLLAEAAQLTPDRRRRADLASQAISDWALFIGSRKPRPE